jgi:hypothetical protein
MYLSFPIPGAGGGGGGGTARLSRHEGIYHGVSWLLAWLAGSLDS